MCTAISYKTKEHYFGRNLDVEYSYNESIVITPRHKPFDFRKERTLHRHYAMIGTAYVKDDYPLYYDAVNEKGLGIAGLSFPGNAVYLKEQKDKENISPFELIPWILGQCESVREAREYLMRANLVPIPFDETLPLTALHFMLSDAEESIVIEPTEKGIILHHNPVKVLTNNPPFLYQLQNLNSYMSLSRKTPMNHFAKELPLESYSRGMGALGLPGDLSSTSRFVKAAFVKWNSLEGRNEMEDVNQFFHILGSVEQPRGSVELHNGMYELTRYSSCCNTTRGIYYYKTYENSRITAVDMRREDLEGKHLIAFPMRDEWSVKWEN